MINPELYKLKLYKYWSDFICSLLLFITIFIVGYISNNILILIISSVFFYRLGAFMHEICHQNKNPKFKSFKIVWNLTIGCLIGQPSLRFTKPHLEHHKVGIFATEKDPQYPLIYSSIYKAFGIFILLPFIIPIFNVITCVLPIKNNKLNSIFYKGIFNKQESQELFIYELYYSIIYCIAFFLMPVNILLCFYLVSVISWGLSVLRIPLEHPLTEYKKVSNKKDQEVLSFTHYNMFYIIHHMYPKIPYYTLETITKDLFTK
jgi:fatty acid desaturase